jgi:hypothetical protein
MSDGQGDTMRQIDADDRATRNPGVPERRDAADADPDQWQDNEPSKVVCSICGAEIVRGCEHNPPTVFREGPPLAYQATGGADWQSDGGWRPIETAPKDGTRVLVCHCGVSNVDIAYWDAPEWGDEPCWIARDCDDAYYTNYLTGGDTPTYWMPLPKPPNEEVRCNTATN